MRTVHGKACGARRLITSMISITGAIRPCQTPRKNWDRSPPDAACADSADPAAQAPSARMRTTALATLMDRFILISFAGNGFGVRLPPRLVSVTLSLVRMPYLGAALLAASTVGEDKLLATYLQPFKDSDA